MDNKNLFKEAIADAKAVREAALANAKAALEEALTPKLQSMLATKLQEMDYDAEVDDLEDAEEEMQEGFTTSHGDDSEENLDFNLEEEMEDESMMDEDFDLSEILAELEDEEMEEKLNRGGYTGSLKDKNEKTTVATTKSDTAYSKLSEAKDDEESEDEESEEENVADMSVEDLKALIKDIVSQEIEAEEAEEPEAESEEEVSNEEESDEINLDELLAELDALGEGDDDEDEVNELFGFGKKKDQSSQDKSSQKSCPEGQAKWKDGRCYPVMEDDYHSTKEIPRLENGHIIVANQIWSMEEGKKSTKKEKEEMKEAIRTINTLRSELNEVNLLNAKLLYVNKIFKAKNLSESQKLKVIASFDKATTAKEAKVVFESLNTTLTAAPKQAIKESLGFASRAAGTAPRKAIVETNDAITRMQKLANIIK